MITQDIVGKLRNLYKVPKDDGVTRRPGVTDLPAQSASERLKFCK